MHIITNTHTDTHISVYESTPVWALPIIISQTFAYSTVTGKVELILVVMRQQREFESPHVHVMTL